MNISVTVAVDNQVDDELTEAGEIEVYERMGEATTYRLRLSADIADGDMPFLVDDRVGPGSMIDIEVTVDNETCHLVHGPVTGQNITLEHGGAGSTVDVEGSDRTVEMDRVNKPVVWQDVTDSDVAHSILGSYGLTPDIEVTNAGHYEKKHNLVQRNTDLQFIKQLARRNGFLFWLTCDGPGLEAAHFKKPPLNGSPAAKLLINFNPPTIESLSIDWSAEYPTSVTGLQLDLSNKNTIDAARSGNPLTDLGETALEAISTEERSAHVVPPVDDSGDLIGRSNGVLTETSWFVNASCKTTPQLVGALVRAHTVVELLGAGSRHSGRYFVSGVRHNITAGSYTMDIELIRNAWSS